MNIGEHEHYFRECMRKITGNVYKEPEDAFGLSAVKFEHRVDKCLHQPWDSEPLSNSSHHETCEIQEIVVFFFSFKFAYELFNNMEIIITRILNIKALMKYSGHIPGWEDDCWSMISCNVESNREGLNMLACLQCARDWRKMKDQAKWESPQIHEKANEGMNQPMTDQVKKAKEMEELKVSMSTKLPATNRFLLWMGADCHGEHPNDLSDQSVDTHTRQSAEHDRAGWLRNGG